VRYRRCISVALAYGRRPEAPWYALINSDRRHPSSWVACEHLKPGRAPDGVGLILAQMGPAWSERHWDALPKGTYGGGLPDAALAVHLLLRQLLGQDLGPPRWADAHRWRYALPEGAAGAGAEQAGIYLAGDMLAGQGRAHLAIESGWAAARRIMSSGTLSG
jgi:renalase